MAFGPEDRIAAGYVSGAGSGVVVFDAHGERVRPAPPMVEEGGVRGVAFGPEGRITAGYWGYPCGVVVFDARGERLRPAPLKVEEDFVRGVAFGPEGPHRRQCYAPAAGPTPAAWWSSTRAGSGSARRRWRSRRATSGAWPFGPGGRITVGYAGFGPGGGVVIFDAP